MKALNQALFLVELPETKMQTKRAVKIGISLISLIAILVAVIFWGINGGISKTAERSSFMPRLHAASASSAPRQSASAAARTSKEELPDVFEARIQVSSKNKDGYFYVDGEISIECNVNIPEGRTEGSPSESVLISIYNDVKKEFAAKNIKINKNAPEYSVKAEISFKEAGTHNILCAAQLGDLYAIDRIHLYAQSAHKQ